MSRDLPQQPRDRVTGPLPGPLPGLARVIVLHALHHWGRTAILAAVVAVAAAVPIVGRVVVAQFEESLHARAQTVPLIIGASGSRFDLVFTALHFRQSASGVLPLGEVDEVRAQGTPVIPMHARFTARGEPLVAVGYEYFEHRRLAAATGRLPATLTEAVLGSHAATKLGLGVGDELPSDQRTTLDITAPASIIMSIVGVLAPTGTPDDHAVFVDLETAWLLEGIAHGHDDAETITDPASLFGRVGDRVALSEAVRTYQRVTKENASSFHLHSERKNLPVTALLVFPPDEKTSTILAARYNADPAMQAVRPTRVIDELIAFVVRLRSVFDAIALLLGGSTAVLLALIVALSVRIRADELATLGEIGVSRRAVTAVALGELVVIAGLAACLAAVLVAALIGLVAGWLPIG